MYRPIEINRQELTIMGVPFPDLETLDSVANGIGTNMFEGFVPTQKSVEIIRDYVLEIITFSQLVNIVKNGEYV